jgi:hypothetical protein
MVAYGSHPLTSGETVVTAQGISYFFKPDHRDGTAIKSQWRVDYAAELDMFERSYVDGSPKLWHLSGGTSVGVSARAYGEPRNLYIALFRSGDVWHGYPADPQRSVGDIPPTAVVRAWKQRGLLSKAQAVRLLGQRPWV